MALLTRLSSEEGDAITAGGQGRRGPDRGGPPDLRHRPGGHSQIGAEEVFSRAGGLACIYAFIDDGFYLGHGAGRSMRIERTPGLRARPPRPRSRSTPATC